MKKETEQQILSDLAVIKATMTEIKDTVRKDHDEVTKLTNIKKDFNNHLTIERSLFATVFTIISVLSGIFVIVIKVVVH